MENRGPGRASRPGAGVINCSGRAAGDAWADRGAGPRPPHVFAAALRSRRARGVSGAARAQVAGMPVTLGCRSLLEASAGSGGRITPRRELTPLRAPGIGVSTSGERSTPPPPQSCPPPLPRSCSLNPEGTDFLLPKGPPSGSQVARLWPPSTRSSEVTPGPLAQARPQWAERRGGGWRAPRSVQTPGDAPGRAEVGPHPCEAAGGTLWRPVRGRNPPAPSATAAGTAARAAATASCPCPVPPRILRSSQLPRTWATDSTTPSGGGKRGPREEEPEPSAAPSPPGYFLRNTRSHAPRLPRGRPVRGRVPAPSCAPTTPHARPGSPATACSSQAH